MNLIKELLYRIRGEYTTEKLVSMGMSVGKNFGRLNGIILDPAHCWLITIGDNVTMAPRVHILCHDAGTKQFLGYTKIGRVTIGDNVFIGAESVVLPGVTIGSNVIIGANSTVTHDIPDGMVAAGTPARVICIHASPADGASAWVRFYVTDVMARIAVPLFYGMTGYLFFGRLLYENGRIKACTENRRRLLRQTLRTATLYLGWSAAYLLIVQIPDWYHAGWWGLYVVKDYLVALIFRGSYYHFWYLLAMLYAMPVLYGLLSIVPVRKDAVVAAVLWVCECLTYSYSWLGIDGVYPVALIGEKMPILFDALFRGVPLLFVGAFLSRYPPTGKMLRWAMPLGLLLLASEATLLYIHDSKSGLYSYLFSTLPAAYLLLRWLLQSKPVRIGPDTSLWLRGLSTTVYLIHPMVIELLSPLELPKGPVHFGTVTVLSILLSALYHRGTMRGPIRRGL